MIREMRTEDCATVSRFWREYLDVAAATEESVRSTFEKMSRDNRYCTYVRQRGIAQQLTERAEQAARERGANSIGAASSFKRAESQAMLDKLGYQKSAFWFHKVF